MRKLYARIFVAALAFSPLGAAAQETDIEVPEGYKLVFHDEFDLPDGSQPNPEIWSSSARRHSAWNRFIKDDPSVVYIEDGALVCRAVKNTDPSDDVDMWTGARETKGKFSFTYGRVEVRLKTLRHTGNFPAAWMMPQPPTETWPNAGEIDIFETIDTQQRAWHTVHTNWTYNLGNKGGSSFNEWMDVDDWHVYRLDWTGDRLEWYVDDEQMGYYNKSSRQSDLDNGQWPFTKPFYIILNQSVGNGSWAKGPDLDFTYETRFDYVRVFQLEETGIREIGLSDDFNGQSFNGQSSVIYDLQGRKLSNSKLSNCQTTGLSNSKSLKGIYIRGGKKMIVQ